MSSDQHRAIPRNERGAMRHSAFEEFRRDERRPAVLLLAALVIAAAFFAFGILLGRWMAAADDASVPRRPETVNQSSAPTSAPSHRP